MEENQLSEQPNLQVSDSSSEEKVDTVKYDTYKRVLSEKKKRDAELVQLKAELERKAQDEAVAEGRKDEVIQSLRKQLNETQESSKKRDALYALNVVKGQIKAESAKRGCQDPDTFLKLLGNESLKGIEVDSETYQVNSQDLENLIEGGKKNYEHLALFKRPDPNIADVTPSGRVEAPKPKSLDEMSAKEKMDLYKQLKLQGK